MDILIVPFMLLAMGVFLLPNWAMYPLLVIEGLLLIFLIV